MNDVQYVAPMYGKDGFTCPSCQAYSHQRWMEVLSSENAYGYMLKNNLNTLRSILIEKDKNFVSEEVEYDEDYLDTYVKSNVVAFSTCSKCSEEAFWIRGEIIFPHTSVAPPAHKDMPEEVRKVYNEAKKISDLSPRASAALLRLALEKLLPEIGAEGRDINNMIGDLVGKGLNKSVEQALDSLRVIGNEAVHPGTINIQDNKEISLALFRILNFIVQQLITDIREIQSIHDIIPEEKKKGIELRNSAALKKNK